MKTSHHFDTQELTPEEVDCVAGGSFAIGSTAGHSWGFDVANLGVINGTINHFNLPVAMIQW